LDFSTFQLGEEEQDVDCVKWKKTLEPLSRVRTLSSLRNGNVSMLHDMILSRDIRIELAATCCERVMKATVVPQG